MARKLCYCDGCGKDRTDVISCGRDSNGDPDAPDLCFLCRKEGARHRRFDTKVGKYVHEIDYDAARGYDY